MEQTVSINFAQGVNTKDDPWQIPVGQFERLVNSIFQKGKLLQKRNGYGLLPVLAQNNSYLTTLNENLVSVGNTVSAYSTSLNSWITKGTLQPCSLDVMPLIKNNLNQTQADSAIANGMICTVFTETNNTTSQAVTNYMYVIADAVTGQNIIEPTAIPPLSTGAINGSSRVYVVGNYFLIISPAIISSTTNLQYVSIPITNPSMISAAQNVHAESYAPVSQNPGWDAVVFNDTLVMAYNTTAGGQGVHVTSLTQAQIALNQASATVHAFTNAAYIAGILSICVDLTSNPNIFYISFYNPSTTDTYCCAVTIGFGTITSQFTPVKVVSTTVIANITQAAQNGGCNIYYEVVNNYSYDSSIPTNYIVVKNISSTGAFGAPHERIRSVGLASKAFIINGTVYFLAAYQSTFQPTYFLINATLTTSASPVIVAKLAYENGGGYVSLGLPNVHIADNVVSIPYLFKDLVEALNTLSNPQQTTAGGIYAQTGINLVNFTIGTKAIDSAEIANNLHISGGYLSQFDGYLPVEHNFFLWPDSVEASYNAASTVTPTGTVATGSSVVTAVSSVSGVFPGMTISGTAIPSGTTIIFVGTTTITMSSAATGNHSAETLTIQGNIAAVPAGAGGAGANLYYWQVTCEWSDNQGLIYRSAPSIPVTVTTSGSGTTGSVTLQGPMLRLTQKVENPVKIVIYRWSENTQVYNQVTSITAPLLNDTTVDSWTFTDVYPDASIVGNNIIYTTGGVVEDVNAPSSNVMTLFDTRLWLVDAEDKNLLWVSKQVIENTPVEMSDLFTIYVAPNTGTVASSGPMSAIAPMDDKLIIFKKNSIYYINGVGPNNLGSTATGSPLGNYSQPTFITAVVGCTNQKSIVLTANGLMFQSDKGIWLLGRNLQTQYIGAPVEAFNGSLVNSANVIPETNYVLFTLNTGEMLMYDYYYNQWGTFEGAPAISSCIYQGLHTLINQFGQILQETPGEYLDASNPVLMSFKTAWFSLAGLQGYERFYNFYLLARYLSPHFLRCQVAYDYNSSPLHQKLIKPKNFSPSIPGPFGDPTPVGSPVDREQWKVDAKIQLCESFQLTVDEVFDPSKGIVAGAGFTMSGIDCNVLIKKSTRPVLGSSTAGVS